MTQKLKETVLSLDNKVITISVPAIATVVLDAMSGLETDFNADLESIFMGFAEAHPESPRVLLGVTVARAIGAYFSHQLSVAEPVQ